MSSLASTTLPTQHGYLCWLIDLAKPDHSENVGVASLHYAVDAESAACNYAEEYDHSYDTADVGSRPLRIGTVDTHTHVAKLVEANLNEDPSIMWWASVPAETERVAFAFAWNLIQPALWGKRGEVGALKRRELARPKLLGVSDIVTSGALAGTRIAIYSGIRPEQPTHTPTPAARPDVYTMPASVFVGFVPEFVVFKLSGLSKLLESEPDRAARLEAVRGRFPAILIDNDNAEPPKGFTNIVCNGGEPFQTLEEFTAGMDDAIGSTDWPPILAELAVTGPGIDAAIDSRRNIVIVSDDDASKFGELETARRAINASLKADDVEPKP